VNSLRVFPVLSISEGAAVKTRRFNSPIYIGDPVNTVRLWSEMCVDEIVCLDISENREPLAERIADVSAIVEEAFVPLSYGGGIESVSSAARLFRLGIEKVVLGWSGRKTLSLVESIAARYGSQAVSCCLDYSSDVRTIRNMERRGKTVVPAKQVPPVVGVLSRSGVGEIIIQCVDRDGQRCGYDLELASIMTKVTTTPLVVLGGAGDSLDVVAAHSSGCSAAAGSLFVFRGRSDQVLIGNPFLDN
jgi:cyclase